MDESLKRQIEQLQAEAKLLRLTRKQVLFCHYWVQTGEGTEAAKRAGYKGVNAKVIASVNLTKVNLQTYISKIKAVSSGATAEEKAIADSNEVMRFFTDVMRGKIKDQDERDARLADRIVCAKELQRINEVAAKADVGGSDDKPLTIEMYYGPQEQEDDNDEA